MSEKSYIVIDWGSTNIRAFLYINGKQIEEKKYATKIEQDGFKKVIRYGIAFYKKECLVM